MATIMTNDPLCLNAPEQARIPPYRGKCPGETYPVDSLTNTPSPPTQVSPAKEQPSPYRTPPDANEESWKTRTVRFFSNLAFAPIRLLASTNTSQRAQVWLGLIGLGIGAYYYYESYLISYRSLVLSQKAYETTTWMDCRDRPDISNTSVCQRYAGVLYDSIAKKRSLKLDVVEMLIGTSRPAEEQELHSRTSCQWHAHNSGLVPLPTQLLCLLHAVSWSLYCAAKVSTLCALVYVYAVKMTPIAPAKPGLSDTMAYTALLCVALSFLMGCWHADAHSLTIKSQWQFVLKGVLCFHWGFAWHRLLQSRRSPLLLLKGRIVWRKSSLFTLSTDVVLFILTALFITHIVSSTMSGLRRFPTTALLWLHLPLLTLLYAIGKALRVHAYVNEDCRTAFDDEAQEDREIAMFRQIPLVESVSDLALWICGRERRRKSNVKKCA
jgi:hypothetical protein